MKLSKISAIILATLTLTACSDDDDNFNTASDVTVEMGETTINLPEAQLSSATYYNIPIVVNGVSNGPIKVTVEMGEIESSPAKDGENYIFTSKSIIIPAGRSVGYLQMYPKDDDDVINPDRQFTITLSKVEGAKIGAQATTLVTLMDDEPIKEEIYRKLQGPWTLSINYGIETANVNIVGVEKGDKGYLKDLYITGIFQMGTMKTRLICNPVDGTFNLDIPVGQRMFTANFGGQYGVCGVALFSLINEEDGLYMGEATSFTAMGNKELDTIDFVIADNELMAAMLVDDNDSPMGPIFKYYEQATMVR
ncbi:MAG: hypothetical protein K2G06_03220 [Muribaculaceae bacterium]|nr:hypothetical protein [Muribaculaceae bacterium]